MNGPGDASESGNAPAFSIEPLGETVLLLRFGQHISASVNGQVHAAADTLRRVELPGIIDLVPAYATLALHYDAAFWTGRNGDSSWQHLAGALRAVFATPPQPDAANSATIEVPVCYEGSCSPDLAEVARHAGLSETAVVERHVAAEYRVAMLGFAAGFPYLLGLDTALQTPRRATPRVRVPRGSVAIGGAQTGIYPAELPGGWHLIGRTPLRLFDAQRDPACLVAPGDLVRFRAISSPEFSAIERTALA